MLSKEEFFEKITKNYTDISRLLRNEIYDEILCNVAGLFEIEPIVLERISVGVSAKGTTDSSYKQSLLDLIRNIQKYDWVYSHLADDVSRDVFLNLIRYRIIPDSAFLENARDVSKAVETGNDFGMYFCSQDIVDAKKYIEERHPGIILRADRYTCDLWELPMLLNMVREDYRYFLQYTREDNNNETSFVVLPVAKKGQEKKRIHRVVAMAPYERPWSNVELVKDCGLIPYLLYKNHQCDVSMVGAAGGEYPYAELVKGMKLEFLKDGSQESKRDYINQNAKDIDCLILRGCYPTNFAVAHIYKLLNPSGKIYVGLDANSYWMDRILWYQPEFVNFMNHCDVIATSGTAMQKHLNEKWPWHIECIPNGYYNLYGDEEGIDFNKKEAIILTVGRLGTHQKNTELLMEAFADIADKIPEWKLHLVGGIEAEFKPYIEHFYAMYPNLKERVIFTGPILERDRLKKEYSRAKIFALPSRLEGGTPNVVAEALVAGCAMAVTKIDAYEDAIGNGACGKAAGIENREEFAKILLELCEDEDLYIKSENAKKLAHEFFDMKKIVEGLYKQLEG